MENPIDHVRFYAKDRPNQAFKLRKDQVSDKSIRTNSYGRFIFNTV